MTTKSKKKKFIKKVNEDLKAIFGEYKEKKINKDDIQELMQNINFSFQEYAHNVVRENGLIPHLDRLAVKKEIRISILKCLARYFPEAVIEYIFRDMEQIELKEVQE